MKLSDHTLIAKHRPRLDHMTMSKRYLPTNVDILQLKNLTLSKNLICQAQNSFGLVFFNLTLLIKGKYFSLFSVFLILLLKLVKACWTCYF